MREVAQSACADDGIEKLQVAVIVFAVRTRAAFGHGLEQNFVLFEIGFLQNYASAITQCEFFEAENGVLLFTNDAAGFRQFSFVEQRFVLCVVNIRFKLF